MHTKELFYILNEKMLQGIILTILTIPESTRETIQCPWHDRIQNSVLYTMRDYIFYNRLIHVIFNLQIRLWNFMYCMQKKNNKHFFYQSNSVHSSLYFMQINNVCFICSELFHAKYLGKRIFILCIKQHVKFYFTV